MHAILIEIWTRIALKHVTLTTWPTKLFHSLQMMTKFQWYSNSPFMQVKLQVLWNEKKEKKILKKLIKTFCHAYDCVQLRLEFIGSGGDPRQSWNVIIIHFLITELFCSTNLLLKLTRWTHKVLRTFTLTWGKTNSVVLAGWRTDRYGWIKKISFTNQCDESR